MWRPWATVVEWKGEKDCFKLNKEALAAMDDAATGRNLSGLYHTVKEAKAAFDEE